MNLCRETDHSAGLVSRLKSSVLLRQALFVLSSIDFRQIAQRGTPDKADRLLRAAVSAYCSLPVPTRLETLQLEDLALPLYPKVSRDTLRHVAALLAESRTPPRGLLMRLVEEDPEISAPLLIRTTALNDLDLIALIARKGIAHARVIGRRKPLHPTLTALITALERKAAAAVGPSISVAPTDRLRKRTAEETRRALRGLMLTPIQPDMSPNEAYRRLRKGALEGSRELLLAALSEVFGIDERNAGAFIGQTGFPALMAALRSIDLSQEQAFLLMASTFPARFPNARAIRQFLDGYGGMSADDGRKVLRGLQMGQPGRSRRAKA